MSFSCELLDEKSLTDFDEWFDTKNSLYEYNPGRCIMPLVFSDCLPAILKTEVRKDDVWMISFPRSGSTWCQEIIWLIGNNLDFEKASNVIQQVRAPLIEMSVYFEKHTEFLKQFDEDPVEFIRNMSSPRFIKTHLPYELLPTEITTIKPKIIYIARNPKDLYCSYHPHMQMFHGLKASFDELAHYFIQGKTPIGCPITHNLTFWNRRHEENILFLRYEEVKADTKGAIRKIANFLEKPITEDEIDKVCKFLTLEKMRDNPSVNMEKMVERCKQFGNNNGGENFIGTGQIGTWKKYMSSDLSKRFDEWIETKIKDTDFKY